MKKITLAISFLILATTFCGKGGENAGGASSSVYAEKFGRTMCEKINECMQEQLANMSKDQRKKVESMMVTDCDKAAKMAVEEDKKDGGFLISAKEASLADACLEHMQGLNCDAMKKDPTKSNDACKEFTSAIEAKSNTQ